MLVATTNVINPKTRYDILLLLLLQLVRISSSNPFQFITNSENKNLVRLDPFDWGLAHRTAFTYKQRNKTHVCNARAYSYLSGIQPHNPSFLAVKQCMRLMLNDLQNYYWPA
jgi:hypothetical protein